MVSSLLGYEGREARSSSWQQQQNNGRSYYDECAYEHGDPRQQHHMVMTAGIGMPLLLLKCVYPELILCASFSVSAGPSAVKSFLWETSRGGGRSRKRQQFHGTGPSFGLLGIDPYQRTTWFRGYRQKPGSRTLQLQTSSATNLRVGTLAMGCYRP